MGAPGLPVDHPVALETLPCHSHFCTLGNRGLKVLGDEKRQEEAGRNCSSEEPQTMLLMLTLLSFSKWSLEL
jgi:hypothetical protein